MCGAAGASLSRIIITSSFPEMTHLTSPSSEGKSDCADVSKTQWASHRWQLPGMTSLFFHALLLMESFQRQLFDFAINFLSVCL